MDYYSKNRRRLTLLIIIAVGIFAGASRAHALSVSPLRIEVSGNPGQTLTKEVTIINESDGNVTYYSSFANFEASGDTGNPSFVVPKDDIGTWMTAPESITLKPNESKIVAFSINVPKNAEPGGHFGALFFGTSPNTPGTGVAIGAKTGTLILLSVAGDVKEAGGLVDFTRKDHSMWYTTLPVEFNYRFKNDGGDRVKPVGKITMHDIVYLPADRIDANPSQGNILPGSTRRFEVTWLKHPRPEGYSAPTGVIARFFDQALFEWHNFALGPYFAKLDLLYGTSATRVSKTVFFFVFPWQLLICLVVLFIIIWWGGRKLIKGYNRRIIRKARIGMNTPNDANHV